jgi:hypothetical protein
MIDVVLGQQTGQHGFADAALLATDEMDPAHGVGLLK